MTRDEVIEATAEAAAATLQLVGHLERLCERMRADFPLTPDKLAGWGDEPRERLHALLRMFEQLYDLVSRRILRGFIWLSGEDAAELSAKNLFRRAETLGALLSADRSIELGTTRNRLAHEYPTSAQRQAERANTAWEDLEDLIANSRKAIARLDEEELL